MEATLGDVTRGVTIRRFDWSPGVLFETNAGFDRIVLRYFPSELVADNEASQEQHYIVQGVFLTTEANKVPMRAGEIVESLPATPPVMKAGNCLNNADFEVGLFPWGKPFGARGAYGADNLDETTAWVTGASNASFPAQVMQISACWRAATTLSPRANTRFRFMPDRTAIAPLQHG
jgi:hypothetical protein